MDIEKISSSVFTEKISANSSYMSRIESSLNKWLALIDLFDKADFPTKSLIESAVENIQDELFNDVHMAVALAFHNKLRAACMISRSCVEISCYALYFIDHPADCLLWQSNKTDIIFSKVCEKIFSSDYLACFNRKPKFDANREKSSLIDNYRILSEYVHGKYGYLSVSQNADKSHNFFTIFENSALSLIRFATHRLDPDGVIQKQVPALGG